MEEYITVSQLRRNLPYVQEQIQEKGVSFIVINKSVPFAVLSPIKPSKIPKKTKSQAVKEAEKILDSFGKLAKFKNDITPEEINKMIDKSYDELLP